MRPEANYVSSLTEEQVEAIEQVRRACSDFLDLCDAIGTNRAMSLAKTKMEEAAMWANKGITHDR